MATPYYKTPLWKKIAARDTAEIKGKCAHLEPNDLGRFGWCLNTLWKKGQAKRLREYKRKAGEK